MNRDMSALLLSGLFAAALIVASLPGAAGSSYNNTQYPADLADAYKAMQDPYAFSGPQSALDQADALREIQKTNSGYYSPSAEGNWDYWSHVWLDNNTQYALGQADAYGAMQNPYAFSGPQSALDQASALREIQKMNYNYYDPTGEGNWDYWIHMWLND